MAKTTTQMAEKLFPPTMMTGHNCVFDVNEEKRRVFELGANTVLEEMDKEITRSFLEDYEGMTEHDREIAQGAIAMVKIWIQQLKGE